MINHRNYFLHSEGGGFKPQITENPNEIEFLIIDLFCGAGGTTTGFDRARLNGEKCALVIACVNHDALAIESHWKNHPDVVHFEEDIRTLDLSSLAIIVNKYRFIYPNAKVILWASLECTNFSKAKGGQPRDADSRTLAESLYSIYDSKTKKYHEGESYIQLLNPDYIQIENVVEFMSWGPMRIVSKKTHKEDISKGIYAHTELKFIFNKKTKQEEYAWIPISKKNGQDFRKWESKIQLMGYRSEWKELNSADFGAYTSRNRLFGCFAKDGLPIVWPEPTHSKKAEKLDLFGSGLKKWKAVKDVLDFEDEGKSIFGRNKALSDKTLERIYAGLIKYVAGGKYAFLVKWNSMSANGKYDAPSIEDPCPVVTTQNRLGACFITKYFSGRPEGKVISVNGPAGTVTTVGGQTLVQPKFLAKYYSGNGDNIGSIENPAGTITTKDRITKVQTIWLDKQYSGEHNHQSIEQPAGVIMTSDKHSKVTVKPFIMDTSFNNAGKSIEEPAPTLLASRRYHYIVNPSHGGHSTSTEKPCPVIIARQDKAPLYLTQAIPGLVDVDLDSFFTDSDITLLNELYNSDFIYGPMIEKSIRIKIIEFMLMYGISDIKMRMLKVSELKLIQGFGAEYHLHGNQSDQKKFIGNSVVPHVVKCWCEAMAGKNRELRLVA